VSVKDNGPGISKKDQKKLFRLFGKLKSTDQMNTNGIGLGLCICKSICEVFNGMISVKSKRNMGSIFTIFFQLEEDYSVTTDNLKKSLSFKGSE
jgi:K+-sensing histidine kinase KdpD